jgi:hypothetical protein
MSLCLWVYLVFLHPLPIHVHWRHIWYFPFVVRVTNFRSEFSSRLITPGVWHGFMSHYYAHKSLLHYLLHNNSARLWQSINTNTCRLIPSTWTVLTSSSCRLAGFMSTRGCRRLISWDWPRQKHLFCFLFAYVPRLNWTAYRQYNDNKFQETAKALAMIQFSVTSRPCLTELYSTPASIAWLTATNHSTAPFGG